MDDIELQDLEIDEETLERALDSKIFWFSLCYLIINNILPTIVIFRIR